IHERDLLKRWYEVADLLPEFAKMNIGIDYLELILTPPLFNNNNNNRPTKKEEGRPGRIKIKIKSTEGTTVWTPKV
ncbi:MAG: hypothetical protein LN566_07455, partial [Rickettsia endosymbiont of Stiretrus anchorago]|nr:hypothetical protein [Rickettsia endosymbiont of Stiretrus anchorago]